MFFYSWTSCNFSFLFSCFCCCSSSFERRKGYKYTSDLLIAINTVTTVNEESLHPPGTLSSLLPIYCCNLNSAVVCSSGIRKFQTAFSRPNTLLGDSYKWLVCTWKTRNQCRQYPMQYLQNKYAIQLQIQWDHSFWWRMPYPYWSCTQGKIRSVWSSKAAGWTLYKKKKIEKKRKEKVMNKTEKE